MATCQHYFDKRSLANENHPAGVYRVRRDSDLGGGATTCRCGLIDSRIIEMGMLNDLYKSLSHRIYNRNPRHFWHVFPVWKMTLLNCLLSF